MERLDTVIDGVRSFKHRPRGLTGGQLLVSLAGSVLAGGSHRAHLDSLREDPAWQVLRAVAAVPAPEAASQFLPRFTVRQLRDVVAEFA